MENVHTNTYTIIQITGEILEVVEEIERKDCQTLRHYSINSKQMDEVSDFVKSLIIQ